ncbi:MAG: tRNA uridine-5-carboxymethylaminomethyl(34) synthesis GTPase MnmE [Candidatus Cloacimonadota bacterium]|nr:tRNA uridine-5-carboxymethylaminomethyl(34) synthesis GTPase MnmE [Candidatus Cloacimonadota bacterium]
MIGHSDTIAAIATPIGTGGISVVRISGANSLKIIQKIFKGKTSTDNFSSHHIYYGEIYSGNQLIDDVLVSVFISPRSYTGEDVIEVSCHGGRFVTQKVLETVLSNGARLAEPGEFTKRAFLNSKMDLTEAESVIDLINSKTKRTQQAAINRLEGKLFQSIHGFISEISTLRSEIELDIDFSDQGIQKTSQSSTIVKIKSIHKKIVQLINSGNEGIILNEGYRVVIAGEPNAGKSSLFNKIIENERSIVTDIPGTTRDYIEEDIALDGYFIKLFDTAGLTESKEIIEKVGINKSYDLIEKSHLIIWVEDVLKKNKIKLSQSIILKDHIVVMNKVDLLKNEKLEGKLKDKIVSVSSLTGYGIPELKKAITDKIDIAKIDNSFGLISNTRQLAAAKKCEQKLKNAFNTAKLETGLEFVAFELREASEALEEIIGKITSDEIINSIFDRFCVGK